MPPKVQLQLKQEAVYAASDIIQGTVTVRTSELLRVKTLDIVLHCREFVGKEVEKVGTNARYIMSIGPGSYEPQFEKVFNITDHLRVRSRLRPEREAETFVEPICEWSHLQPEPSTIDYSYKSEGCVIDKGTTELPFRLTIPGLAKPPSLKTSEGHYIEWYVGVDLLFMNPRFPSIKPNQLIHVYPNPVVTGDFAKVVVLDTQYMLTFYLRNSKPTLRKLFGGKSSGEGEKLLVTMILRVPELGIKQSREENPISLDLEQDREGLELRIHKIVVLLEETIDVTIYGLQRSKSQEKKTYVFFQDGQVNEDSWQALPKINAQLRRARCSEMLPGTFRTNNLQCSYTMTVTLTVSTTNRSEKTKMVISTPVIVHSYRAVFDDH